MATAAERQRAYRQRNRDAGRINTVVSATAEAALRRVAAHHGETRRAVLEAALAKAERDATRGMTDAELRSYYRT